MYVQNLSELFGNKSWLGNYNPKNYIIDSYFYWVQFQIIIEFFIIVVYIGMEQRACPFWYGVSEASECNKADARH